MSVNVVIMNGEGKFLASAWFTPPRNIMKTRWVSEYPDCSEYTLGEARRVARKLRGAGVSCKIVVDHGLQTERVE